jgi:hypothetical protein
VLSIAKEFDNGFQLGDAILPVEEWLNANLGEYTDMNSEPYDPGPTFEGGDEDPMWGEIEARVIKECNVDACAYGVECVFFITGPGWYLWTYYRVKYVNGNKRFKDRTWHNFALFIEDEHLALQCKLAMS